MAAPLPFIGSTRHNPALGIKPDKSRSVYLQECGERYSESGLRSRGGSLLGPVVNTGTWQDGHPTDLNINSPRAAVPSSGTRSGGAR